jgi:hypothetical protein
MVALVGLRVHTGHCGRFLCLSLCAALLIVSVRVDGATYLVVR